MRQRRSSQISLSDTPCHCVSRYVCRFFLFSMGGLLIRLGKISELCSPHPFYLALGENQSERQLNYRSLFSSQVVGNLLEDIRRASHSNMALGNDKFKDELENLTGRGLHNLPPGRKLGWRKNTI